MHLTGKNKAQFQEWFTSDARFFAISCIAPRNNYDDAVLAAFEQLPFEMQLGVYLAYYNSSSINITSPQHDLHSRYNYRIVFFPDLFEGNILYQTMNEAYEEALKKADELINNFLK